jgi:hypothetical protein
MLYRVASEVNIYEVHVWSVLAAGLRAKNWALTVN